MNQVLVLGAGVTGCAAAAQLADEGIPVILVEKAPHIGGHARQYGCKATQHCNHCGLCLVGELWDRVETHPFIQLVLNAQLTRLEGSAGNFTIHLSNQTHFSGISQILVATGFENITPGTARFQAQGLPGVYTSSQLEQLMQQRGETQVFPHPPRQLAFLQCFAPGKQAQTEAYGFSVCCSYFTRTARVVNQYYPGCAITFFYTHLPFNPSSEAFQELSLLGVEFVQCTPLEISGGLPTQFCWQTPQGQTQSAFFDLMVLAEGIYPGKDSPHLASLLGLQQNDYGFLQSPQNLQQTGIFVAGCAKTPMPIAESYADGLAAANSLITAGAGCGRLF